MKNIFFKDGQLTVIGTALLFPIGLGLVLYTLLFATNFWIGVCSFFLGIGLWIFAGISNQAASIGLRPFTKDPLGWRRAKATYEDESFGKD